MVERAAEQQQTLEEVVISTAWKEMVARMDRDSKERADDVKATVLNEEHWEEVEQVT
jgi:hypothetical protein